MSMPNSRLQEYCNEFLLLYNIETEYPNDQQIIQLLEKQIQSLQNDILHYVQKHQVQTKRLKYLKKQNQEFKIKKSQTLSNSNQIKEQNITLKQLNKSLKEQLKQIQFQLSHYTDNEVTNHTRQITVKSLLINNQTQEVDLPNCELNDNDILCLKPFKNIKTLIIGENNITDEGIITICTHLIGLRKLFINHNQITSKGLGNIHKLSQLRYLDLRCNKINNQAIVYISKLINLSQLSISNNCLTDENLQNLCKLTQLKYLDITSNKINAVGAIQMCKLLQLNNLYLSHNKLNKSSVILLLKQLNNLRVLDVRFNDINKDQKQQIKQELQRLTDENKQLTSLQLFL